MDVSDGTSGIGEKEIELKSLSEQPKDKTIYFWNIMGSACNACVSVLLLALAARLLGAEESDIFSIAWSIVQLTLTIGTFQVRLYQATDVAGKYSFRQYFIFRMLTVTAMIAVTAGYIFYYGYTGYKAAVILALSVYKAAEAVSDVYQGWFQQKERLDLAGKALSCRVFLSLAVFAAVLGYRSDLLLACISMSGVSLFCLGVFELRYMRKGGVRDHTQRRERSWKWLPKLAAICFPLFLNSYLVMSIFNAPKMAIDHAITTGSMEAGAQTVYGIIFMPASVINLIYIVFRPVITKMAIAWNQNRMREYLRLVRGVLFKLAVFAVLVLAGGYLLGIPALSLVYGIRLAGYRKALLILLLGGGLNTFVNVLDNSLTVIRKQHLLVFAYVVTWFFAQWASPLLVEKAGVDGAALTFTLSMAVLLLSVFVLFVYSICKIKRLSDKQKEKRV